MVTEKGKHKFCFHEVNGKKDLTALFPFHRLQLGDCKIRIFQKISFKIFISASDPTGFVDFQVAFYLTRIIADLSGKIDVHGRDNACIDQPVNSSFAYCERIRIGSTNVVWRLLFSNQRRNKFVKIADSLL